MAMLRGSANYIWFETDVLGQGATGAVYKGRHKRSGEQFAVKTFNQMSHMRPLDVQMREFDVLKKVNHENIVKLLAIEEDSVNGMKVIVMELCVGGSLYTLLEEPANSYGFQENEFLTVMEDVAAGMKHLYELGIVHRDIKPGNILLYTSEEGRHIYKLTDFGAARELEEEEQFMSLYGTEEYLFPDMYARAVLRHHVDRQFDASVDLWSLGVTLYHVATGNLPFRPYGGRTNKHTMYQMTANKEPGVISGVQHEPGGPIEFSRSLPTLCLLTKGAKHLITPILAGLMESKLELMWTFDMFFDHVSTVRKKKLIHVFNTNDCTLLHIYLNPSDRLAQFQEAIAGQTDIACNRQDLIVDRGNLVDRVTPMMEARKYPTTLEGDPYFLFMKVDHHDSADFPPFSKPAPPTRPTSLPGQPVNLVTDYSHVRSISKILHYTKRQVTAYHHRQNLVALAAKVFLFILCNNISRIQTYAQQFAVLVEETEKRINWFRVQHNKNVDILSNTLEANTTSARVEEYKKEGESFMNQNLGKLRELSEGSKQAMAGVEDAYLRVVGENELDWKHIAECSCSDTDKCLRRLDVLTVEVKKIAATFKEDKKRRSLSHNEEQIHKFEKHKAKSNCDKGLLSLSDTHKPSCCNATKQTYKRFNEWFKWSCEMRQRLLMYEDHLSQLTMVQAEVSENMDACQSQHLEKLERILLNRTAVVNGHLDVENDYVVYNREDAPPVVDTSLQGFGDGTRQKTVLTTLNLQLTNLKTETEDMKQCLRENTGLLHELQSLVDDP